MIAITDAAPHHDEATRTLHRLAFGGMFEATLVDRLKQDGLVITSLIALYADDVVGHILFSTLAVEIDGRPVTSVSLAPIAVTPQRQRQGIGSQLVRAGLARLRQGPTRAVIVVGHPDYYPRFGFSAEVVRKLDTPYAGDAFMGLELVPGSLAGTRGTVRYPPAFNET
jgi:putative acetyltransferase